MDKRYEIGQRIGKGGGGQVFSAYDTFLKRDVAVKRILTADRASEDEVKTAARNLLGEAQTLSTLSHPNIVTVFDVGIDNEGGFVVMELLKGETLYDTVDRGVLTQDDFVEMGIQTLEALMAAHDVSVMHRDLKPTNVMVIWQPSGRFQTKILDFGLAKFSKTPTVQTLNQDGTVMGSILFMAPEQFERQQLDERTDLYSMGCVYYHSLCGQYPYDGETSADVMNAHLEHRVTPLEILRPDLAPSICQWVMWLINRDIDNRPDDAREALELLPKHPDLAKEQELQQIPVEKTGKVKLVAVKPVEEPVQGANAPKGLVTLPGGARTTLLAGKPGARPRPQVAAKSGDSGKKVVWAVMAVAAILAGYFIMVSGKGFLNDNRLNAMSSQEYVAANPKTVKFLLDYVYSRKATLQQKDVARDALKRMTGNGADNLLKAQITKAPSSSARVEVWRILGYRMRADAVPDLLEAAEKMKSSQERGSILDLSRELVNAALNEKPDDKNWQGTYNMYLEKIASLEKAP